MCRKSIQLDISAPWGCTSNLQGNALNKDLSSLDPNPSKSSRRLALHARVDDMCSIVLMLRIVIILRQVLVRLPFGCPCQLGPHCHIQRHNRLGGILF